MSWRNWTTHSFSVHIGDIKTTTTILWAGILLEEYVWELIVTTSPLKGIRFKPESNAHSKPPTPWCVAQEEYGCSLVFVTSSWRRDEIVLGIVTSWSSFFWGGVGNMYTDVIVRIKPRFSRRIFKDCKLPPPRILHHHCVGVYEKGMKWPACLWEKLWLSYWKRHPLSQPWDNYLGTYWQVGQDPESLHWMASPGEVISIRGWINCDITVS